MKTEIQELGEDVLHPDYVTNKLIELEDHSRRNNIRIDGIEEEQYETWDRCKEKVQKVIKDKLGIEDEVEIDRCHRMKKSEKDRLNNERNSRPRTIICRLLRFKEKPRFIQSSKKLRNTCIFIYGDFYKDTMDLRKQSWEKVLEHRANNNISYLNYRSIVVRNQRNMAD